LSESKKTNRTSFFDTKNKLATVVGKKKKKDHTKETMRSKKTQSSLIEGSIFSANLRQSHAKHLVTSLKDEEAGFCSRCRRPLDAKDDMPCEKDERRTEERSTSGGDEGSSQARMTELEEVVSGLEDNIRSLAMENFMLKQQLDAKERQLQELLLGNE
jgi:hypothetical protein